MLSHESHVLHYNSHLLLEADEFVDPEILLVHLLELVNRVPLLRTKIHYGFLGPRRYLSEKFNIDQLLHVSGPLSDDELDQVCNQPFDLKNELPLRFHLELWPDQAKSRLTFSVHHTICDGAAQAYLLGELGRLWVGKPLSSWVQKNQSIKWRTLLLKSKGWKWCLQQLIKHTRSHGKIRQYEMASLIDNFKVTDRFVKAIDIPLSKKDSLILEKFCQENECSMMEALCWSSAQAVEKIRNDQNQAELPIMIWCPMSLRPLFKIKRSLQNVLTTILIVAQPREASSKKFFAKIKYLVRSHNLERSSKFIFANLIMSSVMPFKWLQKKFIEMDQSSNSRTSTLLVTGGQLPRSMILPPLKNLRVWARGAMEKSPGVGLIYTRANNKDSLTFEFIEGMVTLEKIYLFQKLVFENLGVKSNLEVSNPTLKIEPHVLPVP